MHRSVLHCRVEKCISPITSDNEGDKQDAAMSLKENVVKKAAPVTKLSNPLWRADRLRFVVSDTSAEACKAFRSKEAIAAEKKEMAAVRRKKAKDAIMAEYLRRTYDPAEWRELQARANKPVFSPEASPLAKISFSASSVPAAEAQANMEVDEPPNDAAADSPPPEADSGNEVDLPPDSEDVVTMVYEVITID